MAYKKILVPVDGSASSNLGLREAARLAAEQHATLHLVHVVDEHFVMTAGLEMATYPEDLFANLRKAGRDILRKAEAVAKKLGLPVRTVLLESLSGPVADLIVREAKRARANVIVIGTHGRRGVRRLLLGSDAEGIVRTSPVPVLIVRAKEPRSRRKRL